MLRHTSVHAMIRTSFVLLLLLCRNESSSLRAEPPWEGAAFAGTTQAMLDAVKLLPVPEHVDVEVLLDETVIRFESDGRRTQEFRQVYRILTEAGVDASGTASIAWAPWHEQRPIMQARVISSDEKEHRLNENEIVEAPVAQGENVYSDQRQLQAPLPAIQTGSIVETLLTVEESQPFFAGGLSEPFAFNRPNKTHTIRFRIEIPEHLPFQFRQFGPGLKISDSTENGQRVLEWVATEWLTYFGLEGSVPSDVVQGTQVFYSTGRSWAEVSKAYSLLVEEKLSNDNLAEETKLILNGETDRAKQIAILLTSIQRQVRYTGLLFGQGSIVPTVPEEILRRRYGDCKDQSLLLIAMLRSAGIAAHPVLLRSSFGRDVLPELPGLGIFNHMIVYVPGDNELWIDPTATMVPPGELPLPDQDRLCLVVKPGEEHLRRTPRSAAKDNGVKRIREIHLNELDGTDVTDTTIYRGANATEIRQYAVAAGDSEFRNSIRTGATERLGGGDIHEIRWSSVRDLQTPLEISFRCNNAVLSVCNVREGRVALRQSVVVEGLLAELLDFREYMSEEEAASVVANPWGETEQSAATQRQQRRKFPLVIHHPQTVEYVCRVHWPTGFEIPVLPDQTTIRIGDGLLESRFEVQQGGILVAEFRFETGSQPLMSGEIEAWQKELVKLSPTANPLSWDTEVDAAHSSYRHFEGGDPAAGFRIQRDEVAAQPDGIAPRIRLAESYSDYGFGDAARKLAIRTSELAPESAIAFRSAGFIFAQPPLKAGRLTKEDLQQSIAAYRTCLELNPDDLEARVSLATLLMSDQNGVMNDADSQKEIVALLKPSAELLTPELRRMLVQCMFFAGQQQEILDFVKESAPDADLSPYAIASSFILSGREKALELLKKSVAAEQHYAALLGANALLNAGRHYEPLAELLEAAAIAPGADKNVVESMKTVIGKLRRYEDILLPENDPCGVVQRAFINAVVQRNLCGADEWIHGSQERKSLIQDEIRLVLLGHSTGGARDLRPPERIADIVSLLQCRSSGDAAIGFRVEAELQGRTLDIYVASRDGRLCVITTGGFSTHFAEEALALGEANDLPAARQWLQWAFEKLRREYQLLDPFAGSPLLRMWTRADAKTADASRIRLAATALAEPSAVSNAVPFLTEMREKAKPVDQLQIDRVVLPVLHFNKQWKEALIAVDRLLEKPQARARYWYIKGSLLAGDKQHEAAKAWVENQLQLEPTRGFPLRMIAEILTEQGDREEALKVLRRMADFENAVANDFNAAAWAALFVDKIDERAYQDAAKCVEMSRSEHSNALHTKAVVCAELGKTDEALQLIRQCIELRFHRVPEPEDYYVPGRVAEHLGMPDVAKPFYDRVVAEDGKAGINSTARLAEKRIAILHENAAAQDSSVQPPAP